MRYSSGNMWTVLTACGCAGGKGANQAVAAAKVRESEWGRVGRRASADTAVVGWGVRTNGWTRRRGRIVAEGWSHRPWSGSRLPSHRPLCTSLLYSVVHANSRISSVTIWTSSDPTLDGNARQLNYPPARREPLQHPHLPRRLSLLDNPPPKRDPATPHA